MNNSVLIIPVIHLALAFVPVLIVVGILYKWSLDFGNALYAVSRMLVQLLLVGYFLTCNFKSESAWIVISVLTVMVFTSSWIALRTVNDIRPKLFTKALCAITINKARRRSIAYLRAYNTSGRLSGCNYIKNLQLTPHIDRNYQNLTSHHLPLRQF